jgi:hypothetical protein
VRPCLLRRGDAVVDTMFARQFVHPRHPSATQSE